MRVCIHRSSHTFVLSGVCKDHCWYKYLWTNNYSCRPLCIVRKPTIGIPGLLAVSSARKVAAARLMTAVRKPRIRTVTLYFSGSMEDSKPPAKPITPVTNCKMTSIFLVAEKAAKFGIVKEIDNNRVHPEARCEIRVQYK